MIHNRGGVSVQLTTHDIISLAVNAVQNGRSLDDHILATNSEAASRLPHKRRR